MELNYGIIFSNCYSAGELLASSLSKFSTWGNSKNPFNMFVQQVKCLTGLDVSDIFSDMFHLDYIITNTDRHFDNFGFITSKGRILRVAPIYDNGSSLFCDKAVDEVMFSEKLIDMYKSRPFSPNFEEQRKLLKPIRLDIQGGLLFAKQLINSKYTQHLTKQRLHFISQLLKNRLEKYL